MIGPPLKKTLVPTPLFGASHIVFVTKKASVLISLEPGARPCESNLFLIHADRALS